MTMENVETMISAIRACLESRAHEGYGYGSLTVDVNVCPLNSEPQQRTFDARDFDTDTHYPIPPQV